MLTNLRVHRFERVLLRRLLLLLKLLLRLQFSLLLLLSYQLPLLPLSPNQRHAVLDCLGHGLMVTLSHVARFNLESRMKSHKLSSEKRGLKAPTLKFDTICGVCTYHFLGHIFRDVLVQVEGELNGFVVFVFSYKTNDKWLIRKPTLCFFI